MRKITKYIVVSGNGSVAKATIAKILEDPANQVMVTTHRDSIDYKLAAEKSGGRLSYYGDFNPLGKKSLVSFRDIVEKFAGDDRYAVIIPTGYFVDHKPGIFHTLKNNRDIMNINYMMPANIMQCLIPHMLHHSGGHFVVFSCQSTQRNDPFMGTFTAAKSALESLIKTNANEYGSAKNKILFNAIRVASIKTDQTVGLKPNGDINGYIDPSDVADFAIEAIQSKQAENKNGSITNAFRYSTTFFTDGPLKRIQSQDNIPAIAQWQAGWPVPHYPRL